MSTSTSKDAPVNAGSDGAIVATSGLAVGYAKVPVVSEIDLVLPKGKVVALLGRNGAGKTTLLHTLAGLIPPVSGEILMWGGQPPNSLHQRVRRGLGLITEERAIIRRLRVIENLRLGDGSPDKALSIFPELVPLRSQRAGMLSGGEQQMLALGRVLSADPTVLLIDELSLGLAPLVVERLLTAVRAAASESGAAVLLVEQQAATALRVADAAYVLSGGQVALSGPASELRDRWDEIQQLYMAK
jgi:branched-chain amino acid transport system ATP-binding protein